MSVIKQIYGIFSSATSCQLHHLSVLVFPHLKPIHFYANACIYVRRICDKKLDFFYRQAAYWVIHPSFTQTENLWLPLFIHSQGCFPTWGKDSALILLYSWWTHLCSITISSPTLHLMFLWSLLNNLLSQSVIHPPCSLICPILAIVLKMLPPWLLLLIIIAINYSVNL